MSLTNILVAEPMAKDGIELLSSRPSLKVDQIFDLTKAELLEKIPNYDAILVRSQTKVDKDLITAGKNLKLIGRAGVGIDNIDVAFAKEQNIAVLNTPTGNSIAAAELAFGLMLSLARRIPWAHDHVQKGQWVRTEFIGLELAHKTLGLMGFGNVGKLIAKRALAFDMKVIAFDPMVSQEIFAENGVKSVGMEELLALSDILSLHCALNDATRNILNLNSLAKAKSGMLLINTARGELIEDQALIKALDQGQVALAALDVFKKEPPSPDDPLIHHPKILTTLHLGASTKEAQLKVSSMLAEQVVAFFKA